MGKYSARENRRPVAELERKPHPIWRGIGCLMIILVPILSIALGYETIRYGFEHDWPIPYQLLGWPTMPDWAYKVTIIRQITAPVRETQHFYAYATASLLYMIIIGGVISVVYAAVFQMMGPPRYGPFDAPPPKIKTKRYTR
jgi:hypothetical protein